MAEKPDFDKIFANKATSVHEWDKDDYDTGWGFLGETPPPYELFDSLQRENDTKTKYLYERAEEINTDLTQDINNLQSDLNSKYSELKTGLGSTNTALQQHNVDENAHANLFKRALVTEAKTAANTVDWNTLTESRTYKISGATFAADKHQPVGAIGTGELVVLKNGDDTIVQVYYANSTEFDKAGAYHRVNVGGAWTGWVYNITNKGGVVTGDFDINGKLTVDSIEVSNQLTIGGAPPLKQDAIDKLQDQIIAPVQNIYVDTVNGSDENDGTASNKAVQTLPKAFTLINKNIPQVNIYLDNITENKIYETTPLDIFDQGYSTERINIQPTYFQTPTVIKPTIRLKYGKVRGTAGYHNGAQQSSYRYGNILYNGSADLYLSYLIIDVDTEKPVTIPYKNFLCCFSANLEIAACTLKLDEYTLCLLTGVNNNIQIQSSDFNNSRMYIAAYYNDIPEQYADEIDLNAPLSSNKENTFLTAVIKTTTIPQSILDLENNGIKPSVGIIKKNWS